jgi:predicted amidohydrolase
VYASKIFKKHPQQAAIACFMPPCGQALARWPQMTPLLGFHHRTPPIKTSNTLSYRYTLTMASVPVFFVAGTAPVFGRQRMKIAALQMQAVAGDVAANLSRIEAAMRDAARQGATLLVAPELAVPGYGAGDAMTGLAEEPEGASWRRLAAMSQETKVAVIAGFAERDGDAVYNSALFADGDKPPIVYRKSHLYGPYERSLFRPEAPTSCLIDHAGMKFGMLICYDVEFPENVRRLAAAGAQAVLVPTALPANGDDNFIALKMIPVRAFENQIFIAYVDHCGADELGTYAGLSSILAPDGSVLAAAGTTGEALLVADLDTERFRRSRERNTYLADLRRNEA